MTRLAIYNVNTGEADAWPSHGQARDHIRVISRRKGAMEIEVTDEADGTTMIMTRTNRRNAPYRVRHEREPPPGRRCNGLMAAIRAAGIIT